MKKTLLSLSLVAGAILIMAFENGVNSPAHSSGALPGYCGDPAGGNKTCNASGCHTGPAATSQTGWITSNIPGTGYVPGTTYTIIATATRAGHSKFGFQISPQNGTGTYMGTLVNTSAQTQLTGTGVKYITHTSSGTSGSGSKTWTFNWTAPTAGSGSVTFYGAFNVTNANNNTLGDTVYTSSLIVPEDISTGLSHSSAGLASVKIFPNPVADQLNVKYFTNESSSVEIKLFDIQGKISDVLLSSDNKKGLHVETFEIAGKYPAGIYFVKITVGEKSNLEKVIIQ